ncbi:MAG: LPS-assembly protein LptD, partial [Nonlabens sp.]
LPKVDVIKVPLVQNDSVVNDSVKKPKAFLEYRIESSAKDYKRIDRKGNTITLYNEAKIVYGDITIEAGKIVINNTTGDVFAYGIVKDSLGYTQKPIFSQGTNIIKPDSIIFNKNSQKALTFNSLTTQGEFNV